MNGTLLTHQKAGAHLNAAGSQSQGRRHLAAIGNATGCNDRDIHCIHHLGNQGHGSHFSHVAAGLRPLGDDGVGSGLDQAAGQNRSRHHREDLHPGLLCLCVIKK